LAECKHYLVIKFVPVSVLQDALLKSPNIVLLVNMFLFAVTPTIVQEVYNRDRSPEVDDVEGLAAATTKHQELLKQKNEAELVLLYEI
jgi:hypothetical protein